MGIASVDAVLVVVDNRAADQRASGEGRQGKPVVAMAAIAAMVVTIAAMAIPDGAIILRKIAIAVDAPVLHPRLVVDRPHIRRSGWPLGVKTRRDGMGSRKAPVVTPRKSWKEGMDQILKRSSAWGHCSARFRTLQVRLPWRQRLRAQKDLYIFRNGYSVINSVDRILEKLLQGAASSVIVACNSSEIIVGSLLRCLILLS